MDRSPLCPGEAEELLSAFREGWGAGEYRVGLDPVERLLFASREPLLLGLTRVTVALNQVSRYGLLESPRGLLRSAQALLAPYGPRASGLDLAALLAGLAPVLAALEEAPGSGPAGACPRPVLGAAQDTHAPERREGDGPGLRAGPPGAGV